MRVKLAEWGNSLGLRVPKAVADQLGLTAGGEVEITLEGREARLTPAPPETDRPGSRPPVAERHRAMIEEMQRLMAAGVEPPEMVDWGPDVGEEIIDDGGYPQPPASE